MNIEHFIRLGFSRLRHPLPPVKLKSIHSLAEALQSDVGEAVWRECLDQLKSYPLESEAAEALMVAFLGRKAPQVSTAALYTSLASPSPLSDLILMGISGGLPLINTWSKAHSGEVPRFYSVSSDALALTRTQIVPPIFVNRLRQCEDDSGLPFVRQWQYEIESLIARYGKPETGSFGYWAQGSGAVSQVLPRTCHFPRSAYLRTLALAYDLWDMPQELVYSEAAYAIPGDLIYTQMLPGSCPTWAEPLRDSKVTDEAECMALIESLFNSGSMHAAKDTLIYLDAPLLDTKVYHADLRVIACYIDGPVGLPKEAFALHDMMLNRHMNFTRTTADTIFIAPFLLPPRTLSSGGKILPAIIPGPMEKIGYLQSDLVHRFPYLPVPHTPGLEINAQPDVNGLLIKMNNESIGKMNYWNQRWHESRPRQAETPCGVSLTVQSLSTSNLAPGPNFKLRHFWELTVLERDSEFSEWNERVLFGSSW